MIRLLTVLCAALACVYPVRGNAQPEDAFAALRAQDLRLAQIADLLLSANRHLCVDRMPVTGLLLHSRDQYSSTPPEWFANGPIAVAAVLPGSPAQRAGVKENDAIVAVGERPVADLSTAERAPLRDAVFNLIAESNPEDVLRLTIRREEGESEVALEATEGCLALVEVLSDEGIRGLSDGRVIQISYGLASRLSDQHLAVVLAHELAHSVMKHRRRLEAAGVSKGLLGELGRDQQLNRQIEIEADRLSVHLLANAGYDPQVAPAFWRSDVGSAAGGGILRSWTYPSSTARAELIEQEIALYLPLRRGPTWPGHLLARRDRPF